MSVEPGREYFYREHNITVHFGHMDKQPVMYIRRQVGRGEHGNPSYPIFLDDAYRYRQDSQAAEFQAHKVALYLHLTESVEIRSPRDKKVMADVGGIIENHLDELLMMPPAPVESFTDTLDYAVEHFGLTAKINGETILGA